jgi:hypothetical protein
LDSRLTTLLYKNIILAKSETVRVGWNVAGYGSKLAALSKMMMMMMMMTTTIITKLGSIYCLFIAYSVAPRPILK